MSTAPVIAPQRILIVDDEDGVRSAIKLLLRFDGHTVETACDGEEAVAKSARQSFDVVITDYCMPGMSGGEVAAAIKQQHPRLPIILLTAFPPEVLPRGVDLLMNKPFLLETLRAALAKVLPDKPV